MLVQEWRLVNPTLVTDTVEAHWRDRRGRSVHIRTLMAADRWPCSISAQRSTFNAHRVIDTVDCPDLSLPVGVPSY